MSDTILSLLQDIKKNENTISEIKEVKNLLGRMYALNIQSQMGLTNLFDIILSGHTIMPMSTSAISGWSFGTFDENRECYLMKKGYDTPITNASEMDFESNLFIDSNLNCDLFQLIDNDKMESVFGEYFYRYYYDGYKYDSSVVKLSEDDVNIKVIDLVNNTTPDNIQFSYDVKNANKYMGGFWMIRSPQTNFEWAFVSADNSVTPNSNSDFSNGEFLFQIKSFAYNTSNYFEDEELNLEEIILPYLEKMGDTTNYDNFIAITGSTLVYGKSVVAGTISNDEIPTQGNPKMFLNNNAFLVYSIDKGWNQIPTGCYKLNEETQEYVQLNDIQLNINEVIFNEEEYPKGIPSGEYYCTIMAFDPENPESSITYQTNHIIVENNNNLGLLG